MTRWLVVAACVGLAVATVALVGLNARRFRSHCDSLACLLHAMTEQEYINVRDLSNVLAADYLLRHLNIEHQPALPDKEEYRNVIRTLNKWREAMFMQVRVVHNKETSKI
mgnify:CR=1 FL=1